MKTAGGGTQTHHAIVRSQPSTWSGRLEQILLNDPGWKVRKNLDDDLIVALKSGRVAAGLDVFEGEPKLNPEYVSLKNTFLLPHIGSATIETRTAMGMLALDNVEAVLNGRPAPTLVPGRSREIV